MSRKTRRLGTLLMPNQVMNLVLPCHMAVENLGLGCFSAANWQDLGMFSDVTQILAADSNRQDIVNTGMDMTRILLAIRERRGRTNTWGASGDELKALRRQVMALDIFLRRQTTHRVAAALRRLDALLASTEGDQNAPIELNPASLPRLA